jgi:hypothetical protein
VTAARTSTRARAGRAGLLVDILPTQALQGHFDRMTLQPRPPGATRQFTDGAQHPHPRRPGGFSDDIQKRLDGVGNAGVRPRRATSGQRLGKMLLTGRLNLVALHHRTLIPNPPLALQYRHIIMAASSRQCHGLAAGFHDTHAKPIHIGSLLVLHDKRPRAGGITASSPQWMQAEAACSKIFHPPFSPTLSGQRRCPLT